MANMQNFFSPNNTVNISDEIDEKQTMNFIETVKAFSRTTYKSIFIIDYKTKGFEFVSENILSWVDIRQKRIILKSCVRIEIIG
ncbi:hypothetical protein [Mesonia aestuariivivens]|uniref:Uncharacterized protein n=1 Tax=Mesonia aestuariivivens TaxID=2796128 RepID=A0ABS6W6H9_9FLAO|nr:hypothetical protein [Mesonia aestuariivivens]MBW2962744.1 hypothetical protein [Mesonia aestuariivivens]